MALNKLLIALVGGLASALAHAQAPLGTVSNVNGVATVTQGATGMTVAPGMIIQNGMRFVTTTNGSLTLNMNSGCDVTVPPGHGVTVVQSMNCQQLAAAVRTVVPVAAGPSFPPAPFVVQGVILGGAAGIAIAGFRDVIRNNDEPLSAR